MNDIIFINAEEGQFTYNRTIDLQATETKKELSLGVRSELYCVKGLDVVNVKFFLIIIAKEEQLLAYDITLAFKVNGWKETIDSMDAQEIPTLQSVSDMLNVAVGFMRGALYIYEKNTPLQGLNLPILSLEELVKNIKVNIREIE